ncbi:hypothetical protein PRZ48_005501 [Zasmidium cellare]|uniref:Amino acid permease/ SLC12A domain-containing protein n=1 Tax=Zasmidium cellare TaxID=395010 RepID=A0ABR0ETZ3_ZASCE|nr:hypothetical protein PRZ48_005501 [Zasmidium cellare]
MATWLPGQGGFAIYATRFVDPALGFAMGYVYWFKYLPNQVNAVALVLQYWVPADRVNPGVFIAVPLVAVVLLNAFGIRIFGEVEFWFSAAKIVVILGVIILTLVLAAGGGPNHHATGFQYYRNPGAFAKLAPATGALGRFLAFWATMVNAVFAYMGTELLGVTVGEAKNPRRNIPRAIRLTFWRIGIFYILSTFLLGLVVPYNSKRLAFAANASTSAAASPFVVAVQLAGIKVLPGLLNGALLIFCISASNTDLYVATRTLHGLAIKGQAPALLAKTSSTGVPYYALGVSALGACISFMNAGTNSAQVFTYLVDAVSVFGLLTWISILVSHICFVRARRAQGVDDRSVPWKSPLGLVGSYVALFLCCLIVLTKNFCVFIHGSYENFDYKNFIAGYLGLPIYLALIFGWKLYHKTERVLPATADLFTGKDEFDRDEQEWIAYAESRREQRKMLKWYEKILGYLF